MMKKAVGYLALIGLILAGTANYNFKTIIKERHGQKLKVKLEIYNQDKKIGEVCVGTEIGKTFRIGKNGVYWHFTPTLKDGKIKFKMEKITGKEKWTDCCAKCAGGFEACGSLGVCCTLNGNCCGSGCEDCRPKQ